MYLKHLSFLLRTVARDDGGAPGQNAGDVLAELALFPLSRGREVIDEALAETAAAAAEEE